MSNYMPPFVVPTTRIGIRSYGNTDKQEQQVDAETIAMIETYAPTVAKLISGLSPEESLEVLRARVNTLQQYQNSPILGTFVRTKIAEYKGRIQILERQARQQNTKQVLILAGYAVGVLTLGTIAFYFLSKGAQVAKNN